MVTKILFILLFVVILCKPTCFLYRETEDKIRGCRTALIVALIVKAINRDRTLIISNRKFNHYWQIAEEQTK